MYKLLKNLYVPEWFKLFNPEGIISKLIMFIRVLSPSLNKITDKTLSYKCRLVRSGYIVLTIAEDAITYIDSKTFAHSREVPEVYKYRVTGINGKYKVLGCGITPHMAVEGFDYIIRNNCYWFKDNPSKYCYTYMEDQPTHYTIAFGGDYTKAYQTYDSNRFNLNDHDSLIAYDATIRSGFMGLNNAIPLLLQGLSTTSGIHGEVKQRWVDKDVTFAIMSTGSLVKSYKKDTIGASSVSIPKSAPSVFTVELDGKQLPVVSGINYLDNYPGLKDTYKTLKIYGDDIFLGIDLYKIIKDLGCNFTELDYINNSTHDICSSSYKLQSCGIAVLPSVTEKLPISADTMVLYTHEELDSSISLAVKGNITVNYL